MSLRQPLAVCFDAGTPDEYVAEWTARIWDLQPLDYQIGDRWSHTAMDPNTGTQGTPVRLTYSFIPDGVMINGSPSQLFSRMNQLFNNNTALWQGKIGEVFDRWSELSGLSYELVSDDGAPFGQGSPGVLGLRGDVRIGCINIDGASGVLAYNYYPDVGDMVLDASENWASAASNYIFLRNIVSHEHGHGWGLAHVCPANSTKLLEPYYSSAFNGPQHDDIRAVQRNYGDDHEPNDGAGSASALGMLSQSFTLNNVSLDDDSDVDFYSFSVPAGKGFTLDLLPVGFNYLDGPQNQNGSCSPGSETNTLDDQNLDLYLRNASGAIILAQSSSAPIGEGERIYRYQPPPQGGAFVVEVSGAMANAIQMYRLEVEIFNLNDPYLSVMPLVFDTTQWQQPVTRWVAVRNPGSQSLNINAVTASGPFTVSPVGPHVIPSGDSLVLELTYLAAALGTQTGQLTVVHNGPGGSLACPLTGTAITSSLQFVSGQSVTFGDVPLFTTDSTMAAIRAQGNVPLGILNVIATPPFSLMVELPVLLNPTQSLVLRPRFSPTELGPADGYLVIVHTAPSSPDTLFLHGVGVQGLSAPEAPGELPAAYRLEQNYPNPFNPATTIAFDLPRAAHVELQVFDIQGRLVAQLVNGETPAGRHSVQFDGAALPSGMYLYRLTTPEFTDIAKMMLIK